MSVVPFERPKKLPEVLLEMVRMGKPAPAPLPPERVSKGSITMEINYFEKPSWFNWFAPATYLITVFVCIERYIPLQATANEEDVRNWVEHFRNDAQARDLTFELLNHTGDPRIAEPPRRLEPIQFMRC